ncbi:MAG: GyrI-like domain-containing protein [Bacteroidota bacterium]|nr:GyrI-like domain-containing protein [Bacteroidota bacterium]
MMTEPRIEFLDEKKLVGNRITMTLSDNKTFDLWHSFMPKRKQIRNIFSQDLFSLQIYNDSLDLMDFTPDTEFETWAAVEVSAFDEIPEGIEPYILKGGLYAVFIHRGTVDLFKDTLHFIYHSWFPSSPYELDKREHFEVMGEKYKNNDPTSEEEVWIPIKLKV